MQTFSSVFERRDMLRGLAALSAVLALPACGGGSGPSGSQPATAPAATPAASDWASVVDGVVDTLQNHHVRPWAKISQPVFLERASALKARINSLPSHLAACEVMALVALVGDGHTHVLTWALHRWLPLAFVQFSDGLFVAGTNAAQSSLLGAQVLQFGSFPASTAMQEAAKLWGCENAKSASAWGQWLLSSGNAQRWMGASADWQMSTLTVRKAAAASGTSELVTVAADNSFRYGPADAPVSPAAQHREFQQPALPYWYEWMAAQRVFYFRYAACVDAARFAAFASQQFEALDAANPRALVVDLRGNGGGDSAVWQPFLAGLRARAGTALGQPGNLRFITDRFTFSAAVDASVDLLALGATHVGEAPGQGPNFLGNVVTRSLTSLNVGMNYPTRVSTRTSGDATEITPTAVVLRSSTDYFAGRDPALVRAMA